MIKQRLLKSICKLRMETILKITMPLGFLIIFIYSFDSKGQVVSYRIKLLFNFKIQLTQELVSLHPSYAFVA